jgi:hypothetical protein
MIPRLRSTTQDTSHHHHLSKGYIYEPTHRPPLPTSLPGDIPPPYAVPADNRVHSFIRLLIPLLGRALSL